jgi:hypothetical protein
MPSVRPITNEGGAMAQELVTVDNYVRAETARMFENAVLARQGGELGAWLHFRMPVPIDKQDVVRSNRDTLYSATLLDISEGATLTLPDTADRYMSVMVVNEDHYINKVYHEPGTHELTMAEHGTRFVAPFIRIFVDPADPEDVKTVNELQDQVLVEAKASGPYAHPEYDESSRQRVHAAVTALGEGISTVGMFGSPSEVDPVRHLIGTAVGWGGLPTSEAYYILKTEPREVGRFQLSLKDVPVDGFWSMTIYNRDGFMEANPYDSYSANDVTSVADADGSVTLNLAPEGEGLQNHLYIMDGWNFVFRMYRPRPAVLDGTWQLPNIERVG